MEEWHLDDFFSEFGEILNIRIVKDDNGRSRGFAFVEFLDARAAKQAQYKDGEELMERQVFVKMVNKPEYKPREPRAE